MPWELQLEKTGNVSTVWPLPTMLAKLWDGAFPCWKTVDGGVGDGFVGTAKEFRQLLNLSTQTGVKAIAKAKLQRQAPSWLGGWESGICLLRWGVGGQELLVVALAIQTSLGS